MMSYCNNSIDLVQRENEELLRYVNNEYDNVSLLNYLVSLTTDNKSTIADWDVWTPSFSLCPMTESSMCLWFNISSLLSRIGYYRTAHKLLLQIFYMLEERRDAQSPFLSLSHGLVSVVCFLLVDNGLKLIASEGDSDGNLEQNCLQSLSFLEINVTKIFPDIPMSLGSKDEESENMEIISSYSKEQLTHYFSLCKGVTVVSLTTENDIISLSKQSLDHLLGYLIAFRSSLLHARLSLSKRRLSSVQLRLNHCLSMFISHLFPLQQQDKRFDLSESDENTSILFSYLLGKGSRSVVVNCKHVRSQHSSEEVRLGSFLFRLLSHCLQIFAQLQFRLGQLDIAQHLIKLIDEDDSDQQQQHYGDNNSGCIYMLMGKSHLAGLFLSKTFVVSSSSSSHQSNCRDRDRDVAKTLYNNGLVFLTKKDPLRAFICFWRSSVLEELRHIPFLWIRLSECCVLLHLKKIRKVQVTAKGIPSRRSGRVLVCVEEHVEDDDDDDLLLGSDQKHCSLTSAVTYLGNALRIIRNHLSVGGEGEGEGGHRKRLETMEMEVLAKLSFVFLEINGNAYEAFPLVKSLLYKQDISNRPELLCLAHGYFIETLCLLGKEEEAAEFLKSQSEHIQEIDMIDFSTCFPPHTLGGVGGMMRDHHKKELFRLTLQYNKIFVLLIRGQIVVATRLLADLFAKNEWCLSIQMSFLFALLKTGKYRDCLLLLRKINNIRKKWCF